MMAFTMRIENKLNGSICLKLFRFIFRVALVSSLTSLIACSGNQHGDLEAYISEVKSRPSGRIPSLPEVKPFEIYAYQAHNYRDPFTTYVDEIPVDSGANRPDVNRKREALEQFPLDTLSFVGHLEKSGVRWGLVGAPDKSVYRVQVGNFLGKNYGEILAISETAIEIKEVIPDGAGGWIDRKASLSLSE